MGPQNGVVGDDYGTSLPETRMIEEALVEEQNMAKFSQSAEFKRLKDFMEARINHYQKYLPDGRALTEVEEAERGRQWVIACAIVGEFQAVLNEYEQANQAVKGANKGAQRRLS